MLAGQVQISQLYQRRSSWCLLNCFTGFHLLGAACYTLLSANLFASSSRTSPVLCEVLGFLLAFTGVVVISVVPEEE
jgi:hypothetical protein